MMPWRLWAAYAEPVTLRQSDDETPPSVLLAALLAADGLRFTVVGSAALWLHGWDLTVGDLDIVADLDDANLTLLGDALAFHQVQPGPSPSPDLLLGLDVWSAETVFGRVDALMERARDDGAGLRQRGRPVAVADIAVRVASSSDAWALRRHFKNSGEVIGQR